MNKNQNWEEEIDAGCNADNISDPPSDKEWIKSFIRTQKELSHKEGKQEEREAIIKIIKEIKNRYRCAACDNSKVAHTLGCQALTNIFAKIKERK